MPKRKAEIAVVGGANMDIGGFPRARPMPGDSNPGRVHMSPGGVGRNIAENAVRLGLQANLFSALGDDANGRAILEDCLVKGIGVDGCRVDADRRTSVYLFIDDADGDLLCAVNDMEIQQSLTPEWADVQLPRLNRMDAVCIDANLPEETILHLARNLQVPIFADAVSAAKVHKLQRALPMLHCLKPNRIEAELLTGMQIKDVIDGAEAVRRLLDAGLKRVFLTLGSLGALCAAPGKCIYLPGTERKLVNSSGAGDAFSAALLWAHCEGLDLQQSGLAGMAAASIAMASVDAVNPDLNADRLRRDMADLAIRLHLAQ